MAHPHQEFPGVPPPPPHPRDITKCYQERDCQNMFAIRRFHYILRFFFLDVILTGVRNISEFRESSFNMTRGGG